MSLDRDNGRTGFVSRSIRCVECILDKRIYINIVVVLLSAGLIIGYFYSISDKEAWKNTYTSAINEVKDKVESMADTFTAKAQNKLYSSIQNAYNNSKDAINKKSFHQLPKVHIRSKTSIIEIFTKKSFKTIDDSKKLRLGELKWKLFSKVR